MLCDALALSDGRDALLLDLHDGRDGLILALHDTARRSLAGNTRSDGRGGTRTILGRAYRATLGWTFERAAGASLWRDSVGLRDATGRGALLISDGGVGSLTGSSGRAGLPAASLSCSGSASNCLGSWEGDQISICKQFG